MIVRKLLFSPHVKILPKRRAILETTCIIEGKFCLLFIDSGSEDNVVSQHIVDKLQLPAQPHPRPYSFRWKVDSCRQHITPQCKVPFSVGKYRDTVLCDVCDMDTFYVLLGRCWQFDVDTIHQGRANTYAFVKDGLEFVFSPG